MADYFTELSLLAHKYGSDRSLKSKQGYTSFYYHLLKDKRENIRKVLEIGIGNGGGLMMWRDFFPNAKIYGADNRGRLLRRRNRIESIFCDQGKKEDLLNLVKRIGTDIDLVIDAGSGILQDQLFTSKTLMPFLEKNVIYIIEDAANLSIKNELADFNCEVPTFQQSDNAHKLIIIRHKSKELVSILVPSRNEAYECQPGVSVLQRTVKDIYEKATGNFEVIVGFDGPPYQEFPDYPNLKLVKFPDIVGIKTMINALAATARGKYLYKTDSHCSFGKGFDEILQADMEENWIVMPRFYVLNPTTWEWQDERFYDYFFLSCPFTDPKGFRFKAGGHWPERTAEKLDVQIDETPQIHGSGWFISRDYYFNTLGGFPNVDPMGHAQEPIWLALKNWLGGARVMVNKKTWYAHMHQDARMRGYHMDRNQTKISYDIAANYWAGNKWPERKHDFDWFIEKFMPMPTWPENWKELYDKWKETQK